MPAIAQLKSDVVAFLMAPENGKSGSDGARMEFRARISSTLAKIESMLASGGDGGKFMEAVRPLVCRLSKVVLATRSAPSSRC